MQTKQIIKMVVLNLAIILLNVAIFSEGMLDWSVFSIYAPEKAASITIILMSAIVFFYGNYRILTKKTDIIDYDMNELRKPEDYVEALEKYREREVVFVKDIDTTIHQMERLNRKVKALDEILVKNYNENVDGMYSLNNVISDAKELLFDNIKKMMNRMSIFDQEEYKRLRNSNLDNETLYAKWAWFTQSIEYIKKMVENNEKILLELDNLLVEVSNMDNEDDETENEKMVRIQGTIGAMKRLRNASREEEEAMKELEKKYEP